MIYVQRETYLPYFTKEMPEQSLFYSPGSFIGGETKAKSIIDVS